MKANGSMPQAQVKTGHGDSLRVSRALALFAFCLTIIFVGMSAFAPSDFAVNQGGVNKQEWELFNLINVYRSNSSVCWYQDQQGNWQNKSQTPPPLKLSATLSKAAEGYSRFMADNNCFDHYCDGHKPEERVKAAGYPFRFLSENIYRGTREHQAFNAQAAFERWKSSPDHNKNMLHCDAKAIGIGQAYAYKANTTYDRMWYWTADFGDKDHQTINGPTDDKPPTVNLTSPPAQVKRGQHTVEATASDDDGENGKRIELVEFYLNGVLQGAYSKPPYQYLWDTGCQAGQVEWKAIAYDLEENTASATLTVTVVKEVPTPSRPSGRTSGSPGVYYTYSTSVTDPVAIRCQDNFSYIFDWGDNEKTSTLPSPPDQTVTAWHLWNRTGTFKVKVKAKADSQESLWSPELEVKIAQPSSCAELTTTRPSYKQSETVVFTFSNRCQTTINLPDSNGSLSVWWFMDAQNWRKDQLVYAPPGFDVITPVKPGESIRWSWDQKDQKGNQVEQGIYLAQIATIDAGDYFVTFNITKGLLGVEQAKLDVKAMGYIKQGPFTVGFEISVPVLVNGSPKSTPVSLQFDKGKVISLTAQQKVTVIIFGIGQRTLFFRQWECQSQGKPKQVFMTPTIMLTLNEDTVCTAVYAEGE